MEIRCSEQRRSNEMVRCQCAEAIRIHAAPEHPNQHTLGQPSPPGGRAEERLDRTAHDRNALRRDNTPHRFPYSRPQMDVMVAIEMREVDASLAGARDLSRAFVLDVTAAYAAAERAP